MNIDTLIKNRKVYDDISIYQALKMMDVEKSKVLFVFNYDEDFISILTIGDIQRAIIREHSLSTKISEILDKHKIIATCDEEIEEIKAKMLKLRAECMPILDRDGKLINILFWNENSIVGVVVLLCIMVSIQAHFEIHAGQPTVLLRYISLI